MLYLQAWRLGLVRQTLWESLALTQLLEGDEVIESQVWKNAAET